MLPPPMKATGADPARGSTVGDACDDAGMRGVMAPDPAVPRDSKRCGTSGGWPALVPGGVAPEAGGREIGPERIEDRSRRRCRLGRRLHLMTRAEQCGADADFRRPTRDSLLEVLAHAHGKRINARVAGAQGFEVAAHAPKRSDPHRWIRMGRWNRHETAQDQTRRCHDPPRQFVDLRRVAAVFAGFVVDVDLDQHVQGRTARGSRRTEKRDQLGAIQAFQPVEMLGDVAALVGLQRTDDMPLHLHSGQLALLGECLLDVIFTESALAAAHQFSYGCGRLSLGHGEQSHPGGASRRCRPDASAHRLKRDAVRGHAAGSPVNKAARLYSDCAKRVPPPAVGGLCMDIAELLAFSVKNKASDLHLSAGLPPMIRVDGDVRRINVPALEHKQVHTLIYDIMSDKQRRDYEEFLEVDFSFEIAGLARFRVNAFNQNRGAAAVFRTIPSEVWTLEDLGAPKIFKDLIDQPQGLVLVTGPTGSGKSTTLAAMVDHINKTNYGHILTIEDPIEFVHTSQKCLVNQREVHRDTHGFNEALRSALREDPDFILVGEMRDIETIRLALTAAETGHLVFATLHTSSAAKTIDRIIDVFPAGEKPMVRSMLSESLRAVIAQSLLKKVGGGRIAAHEIMVGIPAIRNLIREDKVAQMYSSIQTGQQYGMQTMDQCLQDLVKRGSVTRQQALEYAKNKEIFKA